jgi:hypothetical protein
MAMPTADQEAEWQAECERLGEDQVTRAVYSMPIPEAKRQFGFRWLGEQASKRRVREEKTYWYVKWTFWAALAAVGVGMIGVVVTVLHL